MNDDVESASSPIQHSELNVGFIGAGNMATAIASGLVRTRLIDPRRLHASARTDSTLAKFHNAVHADVTTTKDNQAVAKHSHVLFLCVKPQFLFDVLRQIGSSLCRDVLIISVIGGVTTTQIAEELHHEKLVRVMPNTPALVGQGAACFFCSPAVSESDSNLVDQFFSKLGLCRRVDQEHLIDAVCALSGSGPAYVFTMIQALSDGAVKMGLSRTLAYQLAVQTVKGAAALAQSSDKHPIQLRDEVMSPAGTTAYGMHALESGSSGGFSASIIKAVEAATLRSEELRKLGQK